ncbi:MAG TPA: HepT-like ribonuclease domain-containing protein [Anaerolineae bacterium]|nr:HepT-like ribonuclease domain-containing protein [Anaerolineae bacterium]
MIGEAARQIPINVRKRYTQVPWHQVTGMRDRLIHGYAGIKIKRVSETIQNDLPPLISTVEEMLKDLENQKES